MGLPTFSHGFHARQVGVFNKCVSYEYMRGTGGKEGEKVEQQIAYKAVPQSWERKVLLGLRPIELGKISQNRLESMLYIPYLGY